MRKRQGNILIGVLTMVCAMTGTPADCKHEHDHYHKRFDDAAKWSEKFDDPKRDEWQKPDEVIAALKLKDDAVVADIGAGTGYFTIRLAKKFPGAKIIAVDVEPDMVTYLNKRAKDNGCQNVETVLAPVDGAPTLTIPADLLLVVDTYHHLGERSKYFSHLGKQLKPGGRLAIIDFKLDSPEGPPVEHRIQPEQIKTELAEAGFEETQAIDLLPNQFFLVFEQAKN